MAHDFADLITDLEAAKTGLARTVKRCRASLDEKAKAAAEAEKSPFDWPDRPGAVTRFDR